MSDEKTATVVEADPAQAIATREAAALPTRAAPVMGGLAPKSIDEAYRISQYLAASNLVPKDMIGKPYNVFVAIEHALEAGVPWMQGVQGTAVINGRPGFFGDLFLAVIVSKPVYLKHDEYFIVGGVRREIEDGLTDQELKDPTTKAVCTFWRRDREKPLTRSFSIADAKRAGLLSKDGPWQTYPQRQLQMRARAFAGRDMFPDQLKGVRSAEELRDTPPDPEVFEAEASAPPIAPRRASEAPPAATAVPHAAAASPAVPPGGGESGTAPAAPATSPARETRGLLVTHTAF